MRAIVYPRRRFLEDYRTLRQQGSQSGMSLAVGLSCAGDCVHLLVPPQSSASSAGRQLWLQLTDNFARGATGLPAGADGVLYLGQGPELGLARGFIRMKGGQVEPVSELHLIGPGMEKFRLLPTERQHQNSADEDVRAPAQAVDFSRVEGALGAVAWRRLTALRFAFVGIGRLGSALASILAREGVRHFTLIDPDVIEPHNLAAGFGAVVSDLGRRKVEALAKALKEVNPAVEADRVPASVTHWRAAELIASADFIVSTPDHDSARLAASCLAALFLKPLLDVGVGVFRDSHGRREMGADIRLVWPGRCLLCSGGLRAEPEARRVLGSAEAERLLRDSPMDWREQRAGSLASLNALAAGLGARLIEDFVEGVMVENGFWTRLEFGREGRARVAHPTTTTAKEGRCCCHLAGLGDDGLEELRKQLAQPHRPFVPQAE
jgi:hypothetical protein